MFSCPLEHFDNPLDFFSCPLERFRNPLEMFERPFETLGKAFEHFQIVLVNCLLAVSFCPFNR